MIHMIYLYDIYIYIHISIIGAWCCLISLYGKCYSVDVLEKIGFNHENWLVPSGVIIHCLLVAMGWKLI
jgi:hypothetical protein